MLHSGGVSFSNIVHYRLVQAIQNSAATSRQDVPKSESGHFRLRGGKTPMSEILKYAVFILKVHTKNDLKRLKKMFINIVPVSSF